MLTISPSRWDYGMGRVATVYCSRVVARLDTLRRDIQSRVVGVSSFSATVEGRLVWFVGCRSDLKPCDQIRVGEGVRTCLARRNRCTTDFRRWSQEYLMKTNVPPREIIRSPSFHVCAVMTGKRVAPNVQL